MSTKMSTDLNITRPTSRVSRPPGGATTFSFGEAPAPVPPSPAKPVANTTETAVVPPPVPETPAKVKTAVRGKVGLLIGGSLETDFISETVVRALVVEGIKGTVVAKVNDIAGLPYGAQSLAKTVDVIIAVGFGNGENDSNIATAVNNSLLQLGTSGKTSVIPGLIVRSSLLEAKALLPTQSEQWAKFAHELLLLKQGGSIEVAPAVEPVIKEKPVYSPSVNEADTLIEILRESLRSHGARGIVGFARKFRIIDDNNNGQIDLSEFTKMIGEHALNWTPAQIKLIFDKFDKDKSNSISYDEFLKGVRGPMNERRRSIVMLAFQILDADKSGVVELNDIQAKYDASKHPDVISGKRSKDEILREFLDTFDSIEKDGRVTPEEFIEYYSNVSASIDHDDYFELMIRNAWHISGGEGWCANSSNRRVLVVHTDGRQTIEEIKNDLGIGATDFDAMTANLKSQGIDDIDYIETAAGVKSKTPKAEAAKAAAAAPAPAAQPRPATGFNPRRQPGGASTFTLG